MNTGVAVTMAAVVIVAIGGIIAFQWFQAQQQAAQRRDPASLIGRGAGDLISGILAAVGVGG